MLTLYFASLIDDGNGQSDRTDYAVSSKQAAFFAKQQGWKKFQIHATTITKGAVAGLLNKSY